MGVVFDKPFSCFSVHHGWGGSYLCPISVREILITAPRIQLTKRAPNSISIALARTLHIVLNLT